MSTALKINYSSGPNVYNPNTWSSDINLAADNFNSKGQWPFKKLRKAGAFGKDLRATRGAILFENPIATRSEMRLAQRLARRAALRLPLSYLGPAGWLLEGGLIIWDVYHLYEEWFQQGTGGSTPDPDSYNPADPFPFNYDPAHWAFSPDNVPDLGLFVPDGTASVIGRNDFSNSPGNLWDSTEVEPYIGSQWDGVEDGRFSYQVIIHGDAPGTEIPPIVWRAGAALDLIPGTGVVAPEWTGPNAGGDSWFWEGPLIHREINPNFKRWIPPQPDPAPDMQQAPDVGPHFRQTLDIDGSGKMHFDFNNAPRTASQPQPNRKGDKETKWTSRSKAASMKIFEILGQASETGEFIDDFYKALPEDVQKFYNKKFREKTPKVRDEKGRLLPRDPYGAHDFGIGQYRISHDVGWKLKVLKRHWNQIDLNIALTLVAKDHFSDKLTRHLFTSKSPAWWRNRTEQYARNGK